MRTYQDLQEYIGSEVDKMDFIKMTIAEHKGSAEYRIAAVADKYNRHQNLTINLYQKILYTVTGKAVPDNWSANFKMACRHFHRFVVQENQFLLGNGVSWENPATKEKLGTKDKPFDTQLMQMGLNALVHGVSFGFFNLDHVDVFSLLEFAPLYDEENGALKAGIRYWQVAPDKPLRATLYEPDGYTDYIWVKGEGSVLAEKRPYKLNYTYTEADGTEIYSGENYPDFPIVPMWGNHEKQSEIVGLREQIDCYDLIKSGFANTVDEASIVYWTLNNAGGMDDIDLTKFVERIKTIHAAVVEDDGASAESHMLEAPYNSREALLDRLDKDLYRDAMALNTDIIAGGAITATQIKAAYEPLNSKTDDFEYCVIEFINQVLRLAGIEDMPTFTRSMLVNVTENIQAVVQAASYLDSEYVTRKILEILGDGDQADEIINRVNEEDMNRFLGEDEA